MHVWIFAAYRLCSHHVMVELSSMSMPADDLGPGSISRAMHSRGHALIPRVSQDLTWHLLDAAPDWGSTCSKAASTCSTLPAQHTAPYPPTYACNQVLVHTFTAAMTQ